MEPLIKLDRRKCKACYACVRKCPVKAIQVKEVNAPPVVVDNRCIGCGACLAACTPNALTYYSSIPDVNRILKGKNTVALVSPAISAEFGDVSDYRKFVQMIRELGFNHVHEVSFGVDLTAYKYLELINDFKGKFYITSYDYAIVLYITKYKPGLLKNLAPIISPMQASAIVAKNLYGEKAKVVYIGPEIANKKEISETSGKRAVDSVITFLELRALFEQYDIKEGTMEFSDFDPPLGFKGSLFPIANGFVQAADMNENLLNSRIITVEGKNAAIKSLDEYEKDIEVIKKHLNICFGNTLIGPGNSKGAKITREAMVVSYAQKRLKNFFRYEWHSNLNKFLKEDFKREYVFDDQRLPAPDKSKVEEVLNKLRRTGRENVGCEDCGYASCKHFAVAVAQGVVVPELCSTYAIQNSKSFIDELKSTNQALKSTQEALKRSEEIAQNEKKAANYAWELTNTMFQKLRAGVVIADANLKIIQANNALVQIIGDEAKEISEVIPNLVGADLSKLIPGNMIKLFQYVLESGTEIEDRDAEIGGNLINVSFFPIKKKEIVGAIVRDMKAPEVQKAEVINRVSEVIEKNLAMVQKIGFLLGEGASDIEKELNSIIEFYRNQGKK